MDKLSRAILRQERRRRTYDLMTEANTLESRLRFRAGYDERHYRVQEKALNRANRRYYAWAALADDEFRR